MPEIGKFYAATYGNKWWQSKFTFFQQHGLKTMTFLSHWYKVASAHQMARDWYRANPDLGPPMAMLRVRTDTLVRSRLNLTEVALEFMGRPAARAANGNFLATWSPDTSKVCASAQECLPDVPPGTNEEGCYTRGRLKDEFALGSPAAMDVYAAPYHPESGGCCEDYVTWALPLGNLVVVGANASAGGFGSMGIPGSCVHAMGHRPISDDGKRYEAPSHTRNETQVHDDAKHRGVYISKEVSASIRRRDERHFDRMCAPVYFLTSVGFSVLRFPLLVQTYKKIIRTAGMEGTRSHHYASRYGRDRNERNANANGTSSTKNSLGTCPPSLKLENQDRDAQVKAQVKGVVGEATTCRDTRAKWMSGNVGKKSAASVRAAVENALYSSGTPCTCTSSWSIDPLTPAELEARTREYHDPRNGDEYKKQVRVVRLLTKYP